MAACSHLRMTVVVQCEYSNSMGRLLPRHHAQHPPGRTVGHQPERAVRALAHVADAVGKPAQQPFLAAERLAADLDAQQHLALERADEQVAAPSRKHVAVIEGHAGWRDRRRPVPQRLLHAVFVRALVDLGAVVVYAVADHRPAVVQALLDQVDLVAALRAVLVLPQLAGLRMEDEALRVAVAIAPDLGLSAVAAAEWTVGRHRAVRPHPHDLADVVGEVLRLLAREIMVAQRQEQAAVLRLRDPAAEVEAGRYRPLLLEDDLDVFEPGPAFVVEPGTRHCHLAAASRWFGEA